MIWTLQQMKVGGEFKLEQGSQFISFASIYPFSVVISPLSSRLIGGTILPPAPRNVSPATTPHHLEKTTNPPTLQMYGSLFTPVPASRICFSPIGGQETRRMIICPAALYIVKLFEGDTSIVVALGCGDAMLHGYFAMLEDMYSFSAAAALARKLHFWGSIKSSARCF